MTVPSSPGDTAAPPPEPAPVPDLPTVPLTDEQTLLEAVTNALTDFRTTVLAPLVQKADDTVSNLADLVKRVTAIEQAPAAIIPSGGYVSGTSGTIVSGPVAPSALTLDERSAEIAMLGVSATNPNPPAV